MEVLRKINSYSLEAQFAVGLPASLYTLTYRDIDTDVEYVSTSASVSGGSLVTFTLDSYFLNYTGRTHAVVTTDSDDVVVSTGMNVVRPYCDIDAVKTTLSLTNSQAIQYEALARRIIEAYAGEFSYAEKSKSVVGMGVDTLYLDEPISEILAVYENGTLIYDALNADLQPLAIGPDRASLIYIVGEDRLESAPVWRNRDQAPSFPSGYNYTVEGKFGYRYVPLDVQEACELLIQDIATGGMRFPAKGIEEFDNKEFSVKFSKSISEGTGNAIADRLLDRYRNSFILGVL